MLDSVHVYRKRLPFALILLVAFAAGCNKANTAPTPVLTTDTLTGALDPLGTDFKTFVVNYPTLLTDASVTLTSLTTVSTGAASTAATMGVGFGSIAFDGSCVRSTTYSAATATLNKELIAAGVFSSGTYCVQVFDSGTITERTAYTVVVKHY